MDAESSQQVMKGSLTPFARAGLLSKLTFWWLNPLMKRGREKPLEDDDIPTLRLADRAHTCYSEFMELLLQKTKAEDASHSHPPPILSTLFLWQWKSILVAGIFALTKVLATSSCPIFLVFFIKVAEGRETFRYEGCMLAAGLFFVKCLESFSERQWHFRMKLVGIQVRSMLSAAIYKKQLKVSPSANFTSGEIVSLVTVDAYRLGEFPSLLHQIWATPLQLCLAMLIAYYCIRLASLAAVVVTILTALGNSPLAKLQAKYQGKLMEKQDRLLQFISVSLSSMKVLKLYAWDMHFKKIADGLREEEYESLNAVQMLKGFYSILFWLAPVLVPIVAFGTCYYLRIALTTSNVFTFLSAIRLLQEPIRALPDVLGAFIDARVALHRITRFFEAPEMQGPNSTIEGTETQKGVEVHSISIKAQGIAWNKNCERPNLRNIDMVVSKGEKVAICGEVGAGKTTLLAAILGELPYVDGEVQVNGKIAYVSQTAWIQTGSIQENILFGSSMDSARYQDTLAKCCLIKDLEMLPLGDHELLALDGGFNTIAQAHINFGAEKDLKDNISSSKGSQSDMQRVSTIEQCTSGDQLIKKEEKETGDSGYKPYVQYMKHGKGFLYVSIITTVCSSFSVVQLVQNFWLAASLHKVNISEKTLVAVYAVIGCSLFVLLSLRTGFGVLHAQKSSRSISSSLITSLFRAPMSFYDSTPLGRIMSFGILAIVAWEVLFLIIPMIYLTIFLTGKLIEYDDPAKLIAQEGSLFGQLVREYWDHTYLPKSLTIDVKALWKYVSQVIDSSCCKSMIPI